jgi:hypothetical protein
MHSISSKIILFKINVYAHPQVSPVPNTIRVSVVCVWVLLRTKTFLHLRRSFSNGIGNWALASFASKMVHEQHYKEPNGNKTTIFPAILKPKFALANNCIVPPCHMCLLA